MPIMVVLLTADECTANHGRVIDGRRMANLLSSIIDLTVLSELEDNKFGVLILPVPYLKMKTGN